MRKVGVADQTIISRITSFRLKKNKNKEGLNASVFPVYQPTKLPKPP
jgi:hypothetical protein